MDLFSNKKGGNGNNTNLPNHSRTNSGMSFLISSGHGHSRAASRIDDGALSAATSTASVQAGASLSGSRHRNATPAGGGAGGAASGSAAAAGVAAQTAGAVNATTVGGSGQRQQASRPSSNSPRRLEEGVPGPGFSSESPPLAADAAAAAVSGEHRSAARARGAAASRPSISGVPYPETPPPLRGIERRGSLVNREVVEDDPKEQIEPELMIGEIQVRSFCASTRFFASGR